ncbi:hypothetical protein FSC37_14810 [Piscinibacter aquaticus]|uniref:SBBP repeat-containing protein n=1 Tax=Piscinibacter aquaticus TaxID=392597 RepID=A0A5C6U3P2_9BURK|nr:hypothetical protein FSC37_14810 [Piscinibacter aquaticus]
MEPAAGQFSGRHRTGARHRPLGQRLPWWRDQLRQPVDRRRQRLRRQVRRRGHETLGAPARFRRKRPRAVDHRRRRWQRDCGRLHRGDLFAPNGGSNGPDLFVAKYDRDGSLIWGRQLGTDTTDNAAGVATDAAGNIYLTGYTFGSLDANSNAGDADAFLVKYDRDGVKLWTRQFGSVDQDIATAIAVDSTGHPYVVGRTVGALGGAPNAGGLDAFVVKFDATGTPVWTRQFGSAADDYAYGVALDAEDDVVVIGSTLGALAQTTGLGGTDAFTVKLDGAGAFLWLRQSGTAGDDHAYGVGIDALGNVFTAGHTAGSLDGNSSAGDIDMFVVKHQADGKRR